jgi:CheY-like chemotaxis protein
MAEVKVLIVDDDEDMRMLAASIIRVANAGLSVAGVADDAETGFAQWRALQPDVVVLDHRMPGRSGLELATQILAEEPAQPIILFSAFVDAAVADGAKAAGICSILEKDRFNDLPRTVWTCAGA